MNGIQCVASLWELEFTQHYCRRDDKYGYIPFQFTNKCYHTSSGNARCFPESGGHGDDRYE